MKKRNLVLLGSLILFSSFFFLPFRVSASEKVSTSTSLSAVGAILYETQAQKVLLAKNENKRMPMASTTKIMTALAASEALTLEQTVTIPKAAVGIEGSSAYLKEGEIWTVKDLLYALLLQSANDAAVALAIASDGSVDAFVGRMNRMAQDFKLSDTHFENPHGLSADGHYTTAKELALIASKMMENPFLKQVCSTKLYRTQSPCPTRTFTNHNKLLFRNSDAVGVKTGFTKDSGRCLVGAIEKDGLSLISVTLNAPNDWNDHEAMWQYAFSTFEMREILPIGGYLFNVPIIGAIVPYATASNREPVRLFMAKNAPSVSYHTEYPPYATLPIRKDDVLGYLCITQDGKEIYRIPLCADADIPQVKISKK